MITERKLRSLPPGTRLRKIRRLLRDAEERMRAGAAVDLADVAMLLRVTADALPPEIVAELDLGEARRSAEVSLRMINRVRHAVRAHLGEDPADWDLLPPWRGAETDGEPVRYTPCGLRRVFLDDLRSPFNVGAVFRTGAAYGVAEILVSPESASPDHPRARRSGMGAVDLVPWHTTRIETVSPEGLFALESGGIEVDRFDFPESGTVIIGNEELGIGESARHAARQAHGICSIPLPGPKASLNVSVAFGIVMQRWHAHAGGVGR